MLQFYFYMLSYCYRLQKYFMPEEIFPIIQDAKRIVVDTSTVIYMAQTGSIYKVFNTGKPYIDAEYPDGGYNIHAYDRPSEEWRYIDNSPDYQCLEACLKAFNRKSTAQKIS